MMNNQNTPTHYEARHFFLRPARLVGCLAATLLLAFLTLATTGCTSRERQLDAALKAINVLYPAPIADGAVLEGFIPDENNIDIAVTQQEEYIVDSITDERMQLLKEDFKFTFASAVREDNHMRDLFQLISECGRTISVSITTVPSQHTYRTSMTHDDIVQILEVNKGIEQ